MYTILWFIFGAMISIGAIFGSGGIASGLIIFGLFGVCYTITMALKTYG